ncbi:cilia- and flagella-associated protein 184 [Paralichthys olivaceus]|uniref:cilia- and flagella-associated protein 184 n=1 Tax=Paralichthys olivaceus TaxID=8255 RepID=UPI003750851D
MDRDHGGQEVKTPEDSLTSPANGEEGVPAVMEASHHEEENSAAPERPPVEAASSESGAQRPAIDGLTASEHVHEDGEGPVSRDGTPESEGTQSPAHEGKEAEEEEIDPTQGEDEDEQLLQELCEERDKALQRNGQLQQLLAQYFSRSGNAVKLETLGPERLPGYEKSINILTDMKQRFASEAEAAQQKTEELRSQSQAKSDEVKKEWQEFLALKQDVGVTMLSRSLGKRTAQARVKSTLAAEQLKHDKLIKQRLTYVKLKMRVQGLEAELRALEEAKDPVQVLVAQLHATRLEQKTLTERQNEEAIRLQNKISRNLELLSNIKEKLFWSQREVQALRKQLAELEEEVARKREVRAATKKQIRKLKRDNQRLKESQGLLGYRLQLQDFEDTVDACDHLEEKLENLMCRHSELQKKMKREAGVPLKN